MSTPTLEVGSRAHPWRPLADGEPLRWAQGPQGGHHVTVSIRFGSLEKRGTTTTVSLDDLDATDGLQRLSEMSLQFVLQEAEGGSCLLETIRVRLSEDPRADIRYLTGHRAALRVHAVDGEGATAEVSRIIELRDGG